MNSNHPGNPKLGQVELLQGGYFLRGFFLPVGFGRDTWSRDGVQIRSHDSSGRFVGVLSQDLQVGVIGVDTVALPAGGFAKNSCLAQGIDGLPGRWFRGLEQFDRARQRDDRVLRQQIQQPDGRDGRRLVIRHCAAAFAEKREDTPGGADAVLGGFADASQEEVRPPLPVALVAHVKKPAVVVRPMPLEGKAQVQ